jgi:hypothetical protein
MTPRKQTFKHDPANGVFGDCVRTCIAAILDKEQDEVPHFLWDNPSAEVFNRRIDTFLALNGLARFVVTFPGNVELPAVLDYMKNMNPGIYISLAGQSSLGCNHIVVTIDGEIVMDPSGNGIVGPRDDGIWWIEVYVPLGLTKRSVTEDDSLWLEKQFKN